MMEHNRDKVIGTSLAACFSECGTDKPLSEEEVVKTEGPVNVTVGGVIWKIVNKRVSDTKYGRTTIPTSFRPASAA